MVMSTGTVGQEDGEAAAVTRVTQSGGESRRLEQIVRELQEGGNAPGHPLHRYKVDDATLTDLERSLVARLCEGSLRLNRAEAAAFVLYCALHFTRTYSGGAWTWVGAKGKIDPENRLVPPALYTVTERGLQAWGRGVYWNGRYNEYLYTVGREGGLPLAVLTHEKGEALRNFLQKLLARIEATTVPAEEVAKELQRLLPATLRQPEIVLLAAELVREIAALRETVPEEAEEPVHWLDEHYPDWRDQLSLRTNDTVAVTLIRGLVQQERPRVSEQSFALTTEWVNGSFQRKLETPRQVSRQDLLGANSDIALPSRLRLALSNGRIQSVRATAMRVGDDKYAIERLNAGPLSGSDWFSNELRLVISAGERELVNRALPGGEATSDSLLPWVFDLDSNDRWVLAARGSYSSTSERLLVALRPDAGEIQADPGVLESLGTDPELGRSLTRVLGVARWVGEEDQCEIIASHVTSSLRFELRGYSEHLTGNGVFVWRGCPEVWSMPLNTTTVTPSRVPETQIEWKPTGTDQRWQRFGQTCLGDVQMRVRDGIRTRRARLHRSRAARGNGCSPVAAG